MTVLKAIKICDYLIEAHLINAAGLRERVKTWGHETMGLAITIAEIHEDLAKSLLFIKKQIQPNCNHPKKMQDVIKGKRYCMNCNMDLDD